MYSDNEAEFGKSVSSASYVEDVNEVSPSSDVMHHSSANHDPQRSGFYRHRGRFDEGMNAIQ